MIKLLIWLILGSFSDEKRCCYKVTSYSHKCGNPTGINCKNNYCTEHCLANHSRRDLHGLLQLLCQKQVPEGKPQLRVVK